jgi:hypothetical protein
MLDSNSFKFNAERLLYAYSNLLYANSKYSENNISMSPIDKLKE